MVSIKYLEYYLAVVITVSTCNNYHQGYAQPIKVLRTRPSTQYNFHSINSDIKIFSRTLLFLQIDQDGKVSGTMNCSSQFVNVEMRKFSKDLVRIKGIKSGRYLAMNSRGKVYSSMTANNETVFKRIFNKSFESFASYKYYQETFFDTFVGIRKNGKTKDGRRTKLSQKTVQFLSFHSDATPC